MTGELRRIVVINEEIKAILALAFYINLSAMNAIFIAKRVGASARGFGQVSEELRRFSRDLRGCVNSVRQATSVSVALVSTLLKQTRVARVLKRAMVDPTDTLVSHHLQPALERLEQTLSQATDTLYVWQHRLAAELEAVERVSQFGGALASMAKIEAVYGRERHQELTQVSQEFAERIEQITDSLQRLKGSMRGARP